MSDQLADFAVRVENAVTGAARKRILDAAGAAGKKSSLSAGKADVGGDLKMSNLRGARLSVGYDAHGDSAVELKFRGPWKLASEGRKKTGVIRPKKRGGKRALRTPSGPRGASRYGRSRGLDTYDDAVKASQKTVPKAAFQQMQAELRKVIH